MSEPVDIAAEIRAYALEGCPTTDTFNEWADHMERLQAELEKERRLHGMARSTISSRTDEVERLQARVAELEGLMISHGHDPEGDKP